MLFPSFNVNIENCIKIKKKNTIKGKRKYDGLKQYFSLKNISFYLSKYFTKKKKIGEMFVKYRKFVPFHAL